MKNLKPASIFALALAGLFVSVGLVPATATTDEVIAVEINPTGSSTPRFLTTLGDYVYFTANDGTHGVEIWFTDGTAAGTKMVGDINPSGNGITNTFDPYFALVGDSVYFRATNGVDGLELYRSPLGQTSYSQVTDINMSGNSLNGWVGTFPATAQPNYAQGPLAPHFGNGTVSFEGKLFFMAENGTGTDIYVYDPAISPNAANAGVSGLTTGLAGSMYDLTVFDDTIYFVFDPTATGVEHLYKLDAQLNPELVVSAQVTNGHNGTIFRLIPAENRLIFLESTDNPEARIRFIDRRDNPVVAATITTTEAIKTDAGIFPAPTVIGSEVYFVTTSDVGGRVPAYRSELRHIDLGPATPVATTVVALPAILSSSNVVDRTYSPVVSVGANRYVIVMDSSFDHNLYPITGGTLGAKITDAGSLYSTMAAFGNTLAHSAVISSREDLGLLSSGGTPEAANRGESTDTFSVKELAVAGQNLVAAAQSPNSGNWDLFLFSPVAAAPADPTPYEGPVINPIQTVVNPGDTVRILGTDLETVTKAEIDQKPGEITNQSATGLDFTIPEDLTPGVKDLTLTSSFGVLTVQSFITVQVTDSSDSLSIGQWTQLQSDGSTVKIYAKDPVTRGKLQFFVNGREIAWVNAVDRSDPKLSFASGFPYLVRTVDLTPGKNRFEIKLDGVRVWRATYVPKG